MAKHYGIDCGEIDVSMIVYNEAPIIGGSVASLVRAGFDSFVVLDMGSDDGTVELLRTMLHGKLKLFQFPRSSLLKHGYAAARNVCAVHCKRRWTLFVDADEILINGTRNGFVEVDYAGEAADLYSMERRNLSTVTPKSKIVGSVERHSRMYRPSPAIQWNGYIHEELHGNGRALSHAESRLVFDHYSAVKQVADLEVKNGLYATMLLRGSKDRDVRLGTNDWHYDVFVPAHADLLKTRATVYAEANGLDPIYHPEHVSAPDIKDIMADESFFETFERDELRECSLDLSDVRTLHSTSVQPWTGRADRALWCEWRHPGEGSRSLTSILDSFRASNWERFIRPGVTTFDIGGHSGDTAIPLALFSYDLEKSVGANVIVVEPNPAVKPVLAVNLALNTHLGRFHLLSAAVTQDDVDEIELADHSNAACNGGVLQAGVSKKVEDRLAEVAGIRYKARGVSMSTLFAEAKKLSPAPIGFIKIDCEGYDKEIIRPCRDLFAEDKPVLFVEWFAWYEPEDDADLFKVIDDIGYLPFDPISLKPANVGTRIFDLICVHRDRVETYDLQAA